jgi:hypothetical protein
VTGRLPYVTKANFKSSVSDLDPGMPKNGLPSLKKKIKNFIFLEELGTCNLSWRSESGSATLVQIA